MWSLRLSLLVKVSVFLTDRKKTVRIKTETYHVVTCLVSVSLITSLLGWPNGLSTNFSANSFIPVVRGTSDTSLTLLTGSQLSSLRIPFPQTEVGTTGTHDIWSPLSDLPCAGALCTRVYIPSSGSHLPSSNHRISGLNRIQVIFPLCGFKLSNQYKTVGLEVTRTPFL